MTRHPTPLHAARRGRRLWWLHAGKRGRRLWRLPLVAVVALVLGSGGGLAYAYFGALGSGSGEARVGTVHDATIATATATPTLVPGGTGTVFFTLHNPNPVAVTFTEVTALTVTTSTGGTTCKTSNLTAVQTLSSSPFSFTPIPVAGGATTTTESIAGLVKLATTAPSTCQGVTFTVTLTLSGKTS
jgi:hypothetical protein